MYDVINTDSYISYSDILHNGDLGIRIRSRKKEVYRLLL